MIWRYLLGIVSLLPFFGLLAVSLVVPLKIPPEDLIDALPRLQAARVALVALGWALVLAYLLAIPTVVPSGRRALWFLLLVIGNLFVLPLFWSAHLRRPQPVVSGEVIPARAPPRPSPSRAMPLEAALCLRNGDKAGAMRVLHAQQRVSLGDAKAVVEAHIARHPELREAFAEREAEARRSAIGWVVLAAGLAAATWVAWRFG